jgi:hypothetical protein
MQTIRLRFMDEAAALAALQATGWLSDEATVPSLVYVDGVRCDIDMIGMLREQTGVDENGEPITTALAGYHVNLLWWGDSSAPAIGGEVMTPDPALREWLA